MALRIDGDQAALHTTSANALKGVLGNPLNYYAPRNGFWNPPVYKYATAMDQEPMIPPLELFKTLADEDRTPYESRLAIPTSGQCAAHLELLQTFYTLQKEILQSKLLDSAFNIVPVKKKVARGYRRSRKIVTLKDTTFAERRKAKWPFFIDFAAVRFQLWFEAAEKELEATALLDADKPPKLKHLPPIDVLMIWHSFLLNPGLFNQECKKKKVKYMSNVPFPWPAIHDAINSSDWSYNLKKEDSTWFSETLRHDSDLLTYLTTVGGKSVECLKALHALSSTNSISTNTLPSTYYARYPQGGQNVERNFLGLCAKVTPQNKTVLTNQLSSAVARQASFVEKMNNQLWICSPAVEGTIERARDRYNNFLRLFKMYPGTMLVPTLDIDIVWHTHQCSHGHYVAATKEIAGRFIDHDDKIGSSTLNVGMEKTKELFHVRFGEEYDVCHCWDCEAIVSAIDQLDSSDTEDPDYETMKKRVMEDVAYYKAVEAARRKKGLIPIRDPPT